MGMVKSKYRRKWTLAMQMQVFELRREGHLPWAIAKLMREEYGREVGVTRDQTFLSVCALLRDGIPNANISEKATAKRHKCGHYSKLPYCLSCFLKAEREWEESRLDYLPELEDRNGHKQTA